MDALAAAPLADSEMPNTPLGCAFTAQALCRAHFAGLA
jgi:hypothetical protein